MQAKQEGLSRTALLVGSYEEPYSSDVPAMAFQLLFLKVDSDKAYDVAQEHGGALIKKHLPEQ